MKNCMPQCNYCKGPVQAEWEFVYGELPTHDYAFCCTDHIPDMIRQISSGKNGEVKVGYLLKWNTEGKYDPDWNDRWAKFFRVSVGLPPDNTPGFVKGINRII